MALRRKNVMYDVIQVYLRFNFCGGEKCWIINKYFILHLSIGLCVKQCFNVV